MYWDVPGLLVVAYGFTIYALRARSGELAWHWRSGTPIVAVLASSRLGHVLAQSEIETVALDASGAAVWRVAHSDVVSEAEIVGGSLVLTSFGGQHQVLDPTDRHRAQRMSVDEALETAGWGGASAHHCGHAVDSDHRTQRNCGEVALTHGAGRPYRLHQPGGAEIGTSGCDCIKAHVSVKVPSGLLFAR